MPALDSLYRRNAVYWPVLYGEVFRIAGTGATILAFGDQTLAGKVNAATFTTVRDNAAGLEAVFTPSEALSAFDTGFDLTDPANWQGVIPILTFNGTDEEADSPDAAAWAHGDGANDEAFSLAVWANITDTANVRTFLARYSQNSGAELREWFYGIDTDDAQVFFIYDESANVVTQRKADAASALGRWVHLVATYAGTGGASAGNGVTLYQDGVSVASTATNNASYVAMEDLAVVTKLGHTLSTANAAQWFMQGKLAGGPLGPLHVDGTALTAAQVKSLYRTGIHALGLG